jgi:hypothetical protein
MDAAGATRWIADRWAWTVPSTLQATLLSGLAWAADRPSIGRAWPRLLLLPATGGEIAENRLDVAPGCSNVLRQVSFRRPVAGRRRPLAGCRLKAARICMIGVESVLRAVPCGRLVLGFDS